MIENHRSPESLKVLRFRIVKSAMTLFAREGIKPITMDRIAKDLQISKRTLYEVFNDKEELLLEGVRVFRRIITRNMDRLAKDIDNVLDLILIVYQMKLNEMQIVAPRFYLDICKYPSVVRFMKERAEHETKEAIAFMQRGVEQGLFRPDVNFEVIHRIIFNRFDYVIRSMMHDHFPLEELYDSFLLVCIRGISTEKGVKQIDSFMEKRGSMCGLPAGTLYDYWPASIEELLEMPGEEE